MANEWFTTGEDITDLQQGEVVRIDPAIASFFAIPDEARLIQVAIARSEVASGSRDGDDLVLTLTNGKVIRIADYFADETAVPALEFEDGAAPVGTLIGLLSLASALALGADAGAATPQTLSAPQVTSFGPTGLSGQGVAGATITLLDGAGNPLLVGGTPVTTTVAADGTWQIPAARFPGGTTANFDGGIVASNAQGDRSPVVDLPVTDITGNVVLGPVVEGNGLLVDLYDGEGNLLLSGVDLDADGNFSATVAGTYPVVMAILRDENTNPDYLDEVRGTPTDLNTTLMALGNGQTNGLTTTVQLNINPVTTIAAQLAGLTATPSGVTFPADGVTAEQAGAANTTVAQAFGLTNIQGAAPTVIFDDSFDDTDGDITDGESYGQVLAMLSGLDQLNNGNQGLTISVMAALIGGGAPQADILEDVRNALLDGAAEYEFNNQGNTENLADLLRAPALGVDNTPPVDNSGASTLPQVTSLLSDAVNGTSMNAGRNDAVDSIEMFQSLVNTVGAVQQLASLQMGTPVEQAVTSQLNEANFTALGLTGLTAPSPFLSAFLDGIMSASNDGLATDTVAELQAILDAAISRVSTPTIVATENTNGTINVSGRAAPNAVVSIVFPDGTTAVATANAQGNYGPVTSATPQPELDILATAENPNGEMFGNTAPYDDTTAPAAPTVIPGAGNANGTLTVTGTGEPGAVVLVTMPSGETVTATVAANGIYTATSLAVQPEGTVTAAQTDRNGNGLGPNATATYDDTTAPTAPTVAAGAGNANGTLTVTGTGEPGAVVSVTMPSGETVTATVAPNGSYTATSLAVQPEGTVTAAQTDRNGNGLGPNATATYDDTTAPTAPTVAAGAGNANGTLTVTGTGEPGAVVSVTMPSGETVTATVAANGSYTATSLAVQPEGTVTAAQTDRNGNGLGPNATAVYDDTTAPTAPTVNANITDQANTISGMGEAGATVTVRDASNNLVGTAVVWTDGKWSFVTSTPVADGAVLSATQTDAAGNTSQATVVATVTDTDGDAIRNTDDTDDDGDGKTDIGEDRGVAILDATFASSGTVNNNGTFTTSDGTVWTVSGSSASSGAWTANAPFLQFINSPAGLEFRRDDSTQTTLTTTLGDLDMSGGKIILRAASWFDVSSGGVQADSVASVSYNGVVIMNISFKTGIPAVITAANGAIVSTGSLPTTGRDVEITLPAGYANTGNLQITFTSGPSPLLAHDFRLAGIDVPFANGAERLTNDVDRDGIINSLDIDADGDRIWDKFESGTSTSDGGRVPDYLEGDSNGNGTTDTAEVALTAAGITSLQGAGTNAQGFILLSDPSLTLDFTQIAQDRVSNLEYIDMKDGANAQTVRITAQDVLDANATTKELIIRGDAQDTVQAFGFTLTTQQRSIQGEVFNVYALDDARLLIGAQVTVTTSRDLAPLANSTMNSATGVITTTGTAERGSTVTVTFPDGSTATATADATTGAFSVTSPAGQRTGDVVTTARDAAGNISPADTDRVTDNNPPAAPLANSTMNSATGVITTTGTAEPGSTVTVTFPDGSTATATADATTGAFSVTSPAGQRTGDVVTTARDAAGNTSPADTDRVTDNNPPAAPVAASTMNSATGVITTTGTAEPGSTVTVTFPDGSTATATADATTGAFSVTSPAGQRTGDVVTTARDAAGNISPADTDRVTDNNPPAAPLANSTMNSATGVITTTGTAEPGSTVTVTFPDGSTATATADATTGAFSVTSPAGQRTGDVVTTARDAAGNISPADTDRVTDNNPPAAPVAASTMNSATGVITTTGTAERGSTVTVTFPDGSTATATADATTGAFSVTSPAGQRTGDVVTTARDAAGNTSPADTDRVTDNNPPAAPLAASTMNSATGVITTTGTAEPGSTVTVTFPDGSTATATADATTGAFSVTSPAGQRTGDVVTTARDAAGNISPADTDRVTDNNPPAAPLANSTMNSATGVITTTGTAERGSAVTVTFPDGSTATATADATTGAFSVTSPAGQRTGDVVTTARDAAGNTSPADTDRVTDNNPPAAPLATSAMNSATGVITTTGTAEPGSTVTVTFPDGSTATATADATTGAFSVTSPAGQRTGDVVTTARDAAGNTSPADTDRVTDNNPPAAPLAASTMNSATGVITTTGTAEPGSTVTVTFPDGSTATATADATTGAFSVTSPAGQRTGDVVTTARDAAGNTSPADTDRVTDNNPPAAPLAASTMNSATGVITTTGTAEPGSTVTVTFPDGSTATATADATTGAFSVTSPAGQRTGDVVTTARDAAGNISPADTDRVTDNNPPAAPLANSTMNSATGVITTTGTAERGSAVTVTFPDGSTATATADATTGAFSVTSPAGQRTGDVVTTARDAAGNTSPADTDRVTDNNPPAAPLAASTMNSATGVITTTGTAEPGSTVTVTFPDGSTATATADATTGAFSVTSPAGQRTGDVVTTARDAAGNTSPADTDRVTDNNPPAAPLAASTMNSATGVITTTGTAEPGSTVTVTFPDGSTATATADATTGAFSVTSPAGQRTGDVVTTARDAAGNISPADTDRVTDNNPPAAPVAASTMNSATGVITTTGTAEPGSTVTVTFPDGSTATATADATTGAFSVTSPAGQRTGDVVTTARDAAGNTSPADRDGITENVPPTAPTISANITDQANTISGMGEAGATVTVRDASNNVVGTAVVWTDGRWSFVTSTPVADGAVLTATQTDAAGNVSPASAGVTTVTNTDGDATRNTTDTDDDGDGITDAIESGIESTYTTTSTTTASTAVFTSPRTTGYVVSDNSANGLINITAVAGSESVSSGLQGTVSNFNINFNTVATEALQNMAISLRVNGFDDGLFVAINGVTIVQFDFRDYQNNAALNAKFGATDLGSGGVWEPWASEGNPVVEINPLTGTVQILVNRSDGSGREDILDDMTVGGFDPTPNAVPAIDFEAGVTISTAFRNRPSEAGSIGTQTITVTGQYGTAVDIDGDGILNSRDIDTDGDRIWDKYEGAADADGDGIANYRDTDSNGATPGTDTSLASLTAAEIAGLVSAGAGAVYDNGAASEQFILLSDAGVTLDFTQIANTAFTNVEYIDMRGGGAQTVTLALADVVAMTDAQNTLIIAGDSADRVNAAGFGRTTLQRSIEGQIFDIYALNDATLLIDADVSVITT
jgi:hypothetical protein